MDSLTAVKNALECSPRVLLLGQRFLAAGDDENPLFRAVAHDTQVPGDLYEWWLKDSRPPDERARLVDRCARAVPIGEGILALRDVPWRCAFTSCIDSTPRRLLDVTGKRPVAISLERQDRPDPRFLTLFMLFGSTQRDSLRELPPTTSEQRLARRPQVDEILGSLPAVVSPTGHLFIEGWHPARRDWLSPAILAPHLLDMSEGQVSIFGIDSADTQALRSDEYFSALLDRQIVVLHEPRLVDVLVELRTVLGYTISDARLQAPDTVVLEVARHTPSAMAPANDIRLEPVTISQQEFRRLTETFHVPVPRRLSTNMPGTQAELSREFRRFLARGPDSQLDRVRQFAFRRPVLDSCIIPQVLATVDSPSPQDDTIVIRAYPNNTSAQRNVMMASVRCSRPK